MTTQTHHHDFKGLTGWVEIFRAGKQTDSKGRTKEFSHADLDSVIANLNPEHPPRHVITHDDKFSPFSYGDIVELKRDGDSLFARSENVEPSFEALVRNKRLPERSVRLLPQGDGYKLGHLAWLGSEPPAIELDPVQFSAGANDALDFRMHNDWRISNALVRFMRRTRDYLLLNNGQEVADTVVPEWELESMTEHSVEVRKEDEPQNGLSFSSPNGGNEVTTVTVKQSDLDEQIRQAEERGRANAQADFSKQSEDKDKELAGERRKNRLMEYQREVDGLVDTNKLTPAQAAGCAEFMASLATGDDAAFDFSYGEGDGKKDDRKEPLVWFRDFMASMPAHKLGDEVITGDDDVDFDNADEIAAAALEYQQKQADAGITIGMSQAVAHVTKGSKK